MKILRSLNIYTNCIISNLNFLPDKPEVSKKALTWAPVSGLLSEPEAEAEAKLGD